jgi:hypothetical protein
MSKTNAGPGAASLEKATKALDRRSAKKATAKAKTAAQRDKEGLPPILPKKKHSKPTPQVDAMPGMTPLGTAEAKPAKQEDNCTFALRLPRSESAEIHRAAGPGKASQFVRRLAVAAARGDIDTVHAIIGDVVRSK